MAERIRAIGGRRRETMLRFLRGALFALFLAPCAAPFSATAVPPKYFMLDAPRVAVEDGIITARLGIGLDNLAGLFAMLKDGASVELLVGAKLERARLFWKNVVIAEVELVSSLQHNPLTREFSLYLPGETKPLLDKNLDRLLAATWRKFSVRFGPTGILKNEEKDTEYRVVLTLSLQHAKPPPWLIKNFMVWSRDIVDPETIILPFRY
ncbi:MAG: DUF4390 domain-containing protein [Deltaproteobacteria bacterium]|jgi:hypothetical protein|nr:DUF4390 domain-containing protein [Deltaproteobacteria bacterium]